MNTILTTQYDLVKSARSVLFEYVATLKAADFVAENSTFGRGSIKNLLVHIADCYLIWITQRVLKQTVIIKKYDDYPDLKSCIAYFDKIDHDIQHFLFHYCDEPTAEIQIEVANNTGFLSPLALFTHVITHEFHHKGQILSLSRHLGYVPIDTDILR